MGDHYQPNRGRLSPGAYQADGRGRGEDPAVGLREGNERADGDGANRRCSRPGDAESLIDHTPVEDTIKVSTGSAFDLKGSRRQTDFQVDQSARFLNESFEIKLTNQKSDPVTVSVLEHLYRGANWEVLEKSNNYTKLDSHTIEFPVQVPAKGEAAVTYTVRYTW